MTDRCMKNCRPSRDWPRTGYSGGQTREARRPGWLRLARRATAGGVLWLVTGGASTAFAVTVDARDTLAAALATITTDTGAFAPGHHDFTRYTTPELCDEAAATTQQALRRGLAVRAHPDWAGTDTTGNAGAALVARACIAHFTLHPRTDDFGILFELAMYEQNDSLAREILKAKGDGLQTEDWYWVMQTMLTHGRQAAAEALMAQIDARGPSARNTQFLLHLCLVDRNCSVDRTSWMVHDGDTVGFKAGMDRVLQLGEEIPVNAATFKHMIDAEEQMLSWAVQLAPDSLTAVAARARHALARFDNVQGRDPWEERSFVKIHHAVAQSTDAVVEVLAPPWFTFRQRLKGSGVAPRLTADYWFPAPGHPANDTIRPAPGKVNLICAGARLGDEGIRFEGAISPDQARYIKDVVSRYGAAGLTVTLVQPAAGYQHYQYEGAGMFSQWRLFQTPAEEAQMWRWYAQTYEGLPVTVAVQIKHDTWLQDGRRYTEGPIQFNALFPDFSEKLTPTAGQDTIVDDARFVHPGEAEPAIRSAKRPGEAPGICTVIDRDGRIVWAPENERPDYRLPSTEDVLNGRSKQKTIDIVLDRLFHGVVR